jgi:hypothetical protein
VNVEGRKRGLILPFHVCTHRESSILGSIFESLLYNGGREPGKIRSPSFVVVDGWSNAAFMNFVKKVMGREEVVLKQVRGNCMLVDDGTVPVVAKLVKELVGWIVR